MVNRLLLQGLLIFFYFNCFAQNEYKVIGIGFYNCENFYDTLHDPLKKDADFTPTGSYHYTGAIYRQKLHNLAAVIEKMGIDITSDGPAIIGLTEVENDHVLADLADQPEIRSRHYKYAWFYTPDEFGLGTALLYNPKYLQVINAQAVHVPTETFAAKRKTRDILYVYGTMAGDTVHIFVNHWPGRFPEDAYGRPGRMLAATILRRMTDSLLAVNVNTKILILGDFNENPTSTEIKEVLDAKANKSETRPTEFYNPWMNMYKAGLGTMSYHDEWMLTDQVMLSGAFVAIENSKWKFHEAEIFNRDFLVNKTGLHEGLPHRSFTTAREWDDGYSSHFPVIVYLVERK